MNFSRKFLQITVLEPTKVILVNHFQEKLKKYLLHKVEITVAQFSLLNDCSGFMRVCKHYIKLKLLLVFRFKI